MWIAAAALSAVFAGLTTILSKCGIKTTDSDLATAVRTTVVLIVSWLIVWITGAYETLSSIDIVSWIFLILSGLATGASWLCYFKALSLGETSKVAAVDKSSVVISVLLAIIVFPDERNRWYVKIICLVAIAIGTFLMADIKKEESGKRPLWLIFALLSAVFAAATSLLAKIGIKDVDSNAATAIRTCVVFLCAWLIAAGRKKLPSLKSIKGSELLFLVLSGLTTGASWLCYYYAIGNGQVSVVVPMDKLSILLTVLFSVVILNEKLSKKSFVGLVLLTSGTLAMAVFA